MHKTILVLLLVVVAGGVAEAAPPTDAVTEEATAHFHKGTNAYRAGLLDVAVTELRAAVLLKPTSNGIFALGQALREKGDLQAAAHQYRQYLVLAPDGPFAPQSTQFLARIEETLAKSKEAQDTPPRGVPPETVVVPQVTPAVVAPVVIVESTPPERPHKKSKAWLWGVVGGAVVVVGLGLGLGLALGLPPSNPNPTFKTTLTMQPAP